MRRAGSLLAVAGAFIAVGLLAWWHVWSGGPAHTITAAGWGDPAQQIWFLEWVPHAIGSGLNPFVSHAMFAPKGINLVANSSILFPALVASPVTAIFGPIVAFNVLVVLAPATSAFVGYVVFGRYTSFGFGAFLAGLFYGFSPFVLNDLVDGHLHVTTLIFPPLVLWLLDDLVVSERHSPVSRGVLLGLVLVAQALTSLEVLSILVLMGAIGIALLAALNRDQVKLRWRRSLIGFGVTALTSGMLLAWPVSELLLGPRRYKGSIFSSPESYVVWAKALVWPRGGTQAFPHVWAAYVGIPVLAIVLVGAWRIKDLALRLSVVLACVALVFAMGRTLHLTPHLSTGIPLPDRLITKAPFLENLLPVRFMIVVDLLVALALAIVLGAVRDWVAARPPTAKLPYSAAPASVMAGALGILALASPMLAAQWPYSARTITVPAVYEASAITHLPHGSVLLAYPVMNGFAADPMIWQAETGMPYDMVAGYGFIPSNGPRPFGSLPPSPVTTLFGDAQIGFLGPTIPAARAESVRREIDSWQVSDIVVLDTGAKPQALVSVLTSILGRPPTHLDGAWVWLRLRPPALGG